MSTTIYPPGPQGAEFARNLARFVGNPIGVLTDVADRYGDIVHFARKPFDTVFVNHPDYIERILVTDSWNFTPIRVMTLERALGKGIFISTGELHRRHRTALDPIWEDPRVSVFADTVVQATARLSDQLSDAMVVDVERMMARLVIEIMSEIMFGEEARSDPVEFVRAAVFINDYLATRSTFPVAFVPELLPILPSNRRFWSQMKIFDQYLYQRIVERRGEGEDRGDMLSMILRLLDREGEPSPTDQQIRDEVVSIYTGATSAMLRAMTWVWWPLSEYPESERALHDEIQSTLGDRSPEPGDLAALPTARRVMMESMRLYPPAWLFGREAQQAYELDGYYLPPGTGFVMCPYLMHRDPRYYDEPEVFAPDRWADEQANRDRPNFAYFPFGGGDRSCFGEPFAWMAMPLILVTLAQRWKFRLMPDHPVEPDPKFTLRPKHGMRMRLERR
ncbi:cytochrome P450 [soil metagenome]